MKTFKFKKIDAFATEMSDGNPAGAIYLEPSDVISNNDMLKIAKELQGFVSEVGYVKKIADSVFDLRYFSAEKEVEFCGHATIAIMNDLIKNNSELLSQKEITILTPMGKLIVENRCLQEDAVFITAPAPAFSDKQISPEEIATAFRADPGMIDRSLKISIVNAGLETLIVPIRSLKSILSISPNLMELKDFCTDNAIDIITVFSAETASPRNTYRTRVFAGTFGYLEDPATGSGNAAFGSYLLKQKLWDGSFITLEQNNLQDKPNIIKLFAKETEKKTFRVVFGGGAIVRIDGSYILR